MPTHLHTVEGDTVKSVHKDYTRVQVITVTADNKVLVVRFMEWTGGPSILLVFRTGFTLQAVNNQLPCCRLAGGVQ